MFVPIRARSNSLIMFQGNFKIGIGEKVNEFYWNYEETGCTIKIDNTKVAIYVKLANVLGSNFGFFSNFTK